jgi:hypothetical protein
MYCSGPSGKVEDVPSPVISIGGISSNTLSVTPCASLTCVTVKSPAAP